MDSSIEINTLDTGTGTGIAIAAAMAYSVPGWSCFVVTDLLICVDLQAGIQSFSIPARMGLFELWPCKH